jgi:lipopolysaccharide export system permease protein
MRAALALRRRSGTTVIGRYLLSLAVRPFLGTLLIVMPALLMERLLRLFDLVATDDVPTLAVARMLADLVPHYLGLALPAALFVGVNVVVARLSAENELDALQNAGISLGRISRPFLTIGLLASLCGIGLYGTLQPAARYAYRAAFQAATQGSWDATIVPGEMIHVSRSLMVTADRADRIGGRLHRVFIMQRQADGGEKLTTARNGRVTLLQNGTRLLLTLDDAIQIDTPPGGALVDQEAVDREAGRQASTLTAPQTSLERPFALTLARFRARGADEREMMPGELWRAAKHPPPGLTRFRLLAELHGRLARALSLALMPVLAVPLGLATKRARRQYGLVVGVVMLVLYYHAIQLAESLGGATLADPRPAIWGTFLLFAALCVALFRRAERRSSENPLDGLAGLFGAVLDRARDARLLRRNSAGSQEGGHEGSGEAIS